MSGPSSLLVKFSHLFTQSAISGPILDLACGTCRNGILLSTRDFPVVCCDKSRESLDAAEQFASTLGLDVTLWELDLERGTDNPFPEDTFGGILVFRYLHRPLIPCIRKALRPGGILIYETYTVEHAKFGKPGNPDHLLKPGELMDWFGDWEIIHSFEGIQEDPVRAVAQIVCRKPAP
jgi:SAM-dependent methyltransferase